jgi:quercetin dioxygenase-like cupin family protein
VDANPTIQPTVLTFAEIEQIPAQSLGDLPGVTNRVLWQDDTSMAGVLTIDGGYELGAHTHRQNHHHIWVLEGSAEMLGQVVGPGSYVHVPAGVEHNTDARATGGCTIFYLYILPGT